MDVSSAGRQLTWLLAIGGAVLLFFDTGARVLATNDEARFPVMARDILATGRWLLPEIGGVPMLNKPPLHAWLIALGSWPAGAVTQRTAALPSGVAIVTNAVVGPPSARSQAVNIPEVYGLPVRPTF